MPAKSGIPNHFPIVGIGASVGGLEAFTDLLRHVPTDTGLGFVLVQHLDPQHESAITHDLRAPLRALQGFSQMLQEGYGDKLDDAGKDSLRRIAGSADRMDKLIQDVLAYSRVLRLDLRLERVDVNRLVESRQKQTRQDRNNCDRDQ